MDGQRERDREKMQPIILITTEELIKKLIIIRRLRW